MELEVGGIYFAEPYGVAESGSLSEEFQCLGNVVVGFVLPSDVKAGGPILALLRQLSGADEIAHVAMEPHKGQVVTSSSVVFHGGIHLAAALQKLGPPSQSVTVFKVDERGSILLNEKMLTDPVRKCNSLEAHSCHQKASAGRQSDAFDTFRTSPEPGRFFL